ncbi:heparinase II/III family protein [Cognatilysobacter tabacisoli]|uniref:heparinase II/III family protein n=1 Tax=Cognatilysobacter tabacisoli TaxID=2315424 RepID=UPI000E6B37A6|nr:heparinase II/III family protein [Lysobacter tabacisoli]
MTRTPAARPRRAAGPGRWECAFLLCTVSLSASCGYPETSTAPAPTATVDVPAPSEQAAEPSGDPAKAGIPMDLSYVDRKSDGYARFRSWVDRAAAGQPGYAFAASDAALMYRLDPKQKYCDLAVRMVEEQVSTAEGVIAGGGRPAVSGDSYLEVGPYISDLAMTLDTCGKDLSPEQRKRWGAYAEQAVWNVWHHPRASWGGRPHPWTGWATDNPGNNYYYSFLEATMYWGLASGSQTWLDVLRQDKLPPLTKYFAALPGGGSREGTGYGAAYMRLFPLYRLWRDATGTDLANANPHVRDSIRYWVHATVPTLDRFAPIGDQSRNSVPELFDYHRRLVLEARYLTPDPAAKAVASWWLENISVPQMTQGFNSRYDLLPTGDGGAPPTELHYHSPGTGHLFARSDWGKDAMWLSFVAGPYDESHAHQDQGSFTLFARDWLAVTENIWSRSGINQAPQVHNVVRFERADGDDSQCQAPRGDVVVHQCTETVSTMSVTPGAAGALAATADLTPAYRGNSAVRRWERRLDFAGRKLTVRDAFELGAGTRAVFQLNVPTEPQVSGNEVISGRLRVRVLEPANATIRVHDWRGQDASEFQRGWRIDVSGGNAGYLVELDEK